jgi:polyhydroxyalkanoate synthesis regulator phasin
MSGELEALLKLVAEGKLTAEEAAPIVNALQEKAQAGGAGTSGGRADGAADARRSTSAQDVLASRRLRIFVAEAGVQIINLQIPLVAAGFAIDQVPGLSPDHRSRIAEAIQSGLTGPILEVSDHGDEVRIIIE